MNLLTYFEPIFYFHTGEKYYSMLVDDFLDNAIIAVDQQNLTRFTKFDDKFRCGTKNKLQIMANAVEHQDRNGKIVTDLVYYVYFPHNGHKWNDMQHITIRFLGKKIDITTMSNPKQVCFVTNTGKRTWKKWKNCSLLRDKLEVFIARKTHSMYSHPGWYFSFDCSLPFLHLERCNKGYNPEYYHITMHSSRYSENIIIFRYTGPENRYIFERHQLKFGEHDD